MVPAPVQAAMAAALADDAHAVAQRERYEARRDALRAAFTAAGWSVDHSEAGLYLWLTHPAHDGWSAAELLAVECGILVTPGSHIRSWRGPAHPGGADRHRRAGGRRRGAAGRAAPLSKTGWRSTRT